MGGGKGGTSTSQVQIPPEVLARYNSVNARAEEVAKTPFQAYGGEFVAPVTETQQQGISQTQQYSQAAQPYYTRAAGMTESALQAAQPLTAAQIQQYQNPYIQSVVDPTLKALQQQQGIDRAGLQTQAIKAGAFGGDRAGVQRSILQGQQELAQAQAISPLYADAYKNALATAQQQQGVGVQTGLQAGQQYAGIGTGAQQAGLQGGQAVIGAGTLGQQTQQAQDTAKYQQFLQQRGYDFQTAQFLANIAMGTGALSGSTTTTVQPTSFFSDKRLKHDIKKIGKTNDGQPIYSFKYNGDDRTQIGLLAQDVEKKHPEAVGLSGGYKTVDYEKATAGARHARAMGGLVPESMGGAVLEPGNFASGGSILDSDDLKAILAQQKQSFGPFGQSGLYGGSSQQDPHGSAATYVPKATLTVPKLATSNFQPRQQAGGLQTAMQDINAAGKTAEMLSTGYDAGKRGLLGKEAVTDPKTGDVLQKETSGAIGAGGKYDIDKSWFGDAPAAAHGGGIVPRHGFGAGGMPYSGMPDFSGGYMGMVDLNPQSPAELKSKFEAQRSGQMPKQEQGGLGSALGTGAQIYGTSKLAGAGYDKAAGLFGADKVGSAITYDSPAAVGPLMSEAPAAVQAAAAAPVAEGAAAAPVAEGLAAAAPVAEGVGAAGVGAATAAEAAAATAAAAPVAEAGVAAAELLPFLALAFSDKRLKENIKKVGETNDGQNIYKYNFKGDPRTQIGLLAQEVAHDHPQAVGKRNGYLTVDYDKATEDAVRHRAAGGVVPRQGYQTAGTVPVAAEGDAAPAPDFNRFVNRVFEFEGGLNPADTNGTPSLYGINQKAHPEFFENPSKEAAANIYKTQYWDAIGADKMPPHLAHVAGDTAVIAGPTKAMELVQQAGNDPQRLLQLRKEFQDNLIAKDPAKYGKYENAWNTRLSTLAGDIGGQPQAQPQAGPQPQAAGVKPWYDKMAPRTYQGQDRSMGDFLTSKDFVIPLLTGLGTMASSPSRYLGSAILQGLGGGASAFANLQKQQSDIDQTRAETMKGLSAIGPVVGQFGPDGKPVYDIKKEFFGPSFKPKGAPSETGAPAGAGVVPPVKPIEAAATGVIKAPDVPMVVSTEGGRYSYDIIPSNVSTQALKEFGATGGAEDKDVIPAYISARPEIAKKAQDEATVANERSKLAYQSAQVRRDINTMAHAFNEIDNSASGTGPEFANRNKLFYYYNFLADKTGMPKYDAADKNLTAGFILDKIAKLQTGEFAQADGSKAGFIQAAKSASMPSGEMTPEAGRTLIAGMYLANQNQEDFRKFYNKYTAQYGTALGVQDAFNQEFQPRLAREKDLIIHALTPQSNGMSPADILRKNPSSAAQFDKNYGMPGLARTIIGG